MTPATGPAWRLGVDDLEHVLEGERLEVEPVGGVVVGGDRLGVAVDHDGLEAGVAQREGGVHAGVVELDALADPVRPGAEDDTVGRSRGATSVSSS